MTKTVLIVGANGRFGRAAAQAFADKNWSIKLYARSKPIVHFAAHKWVNADALDQTVLNYAAEGCDVIVNALTPPYSEWTEIIPRLTASIINASHHSGATIMVPGNIYNYGPSMPVLLKEDTPQLATGSLGLARIKMENEYEDAVKDGIQTIILRGGDFIERAVTGNWFDSQITPKIAKGKIIYPGPLDSMHCWAYLPDMARALVGLAEKRSTLAAFETIGFPGFSMSGTEFVKTLERVSGRSLKIGKFPWNIAKILSLINPDIQGVLQMSYQWCTPHMIDGGKFDELVPGFVSTAVDDAFRDAVADRIGKGPAVSLSERRI
ncbi:MAG: NAD(P)H-binding protein [Parasphingorhabdus sp.]